MSDFSILFLSGLLGLLSSAVYFFVTYRNMNIQRNQLVSEVDRLENEFLNEFKQINFSELKETVAGRELLELLEDSEIFPQDMPVASSSLTSIVLKSVQAMQPAADRQNLDFHVDIIDPPSFAETKGDWQVVFDQLVHDTIKYSLRGRYGEPNVIRIYGRRGENHYMITLENYGANIREEIFDASPLSDAVHGQLENQEVAPSHLLTMMDFIKQEGGKIIVNNKVDDKAKGKSENENSVNQITLYIPVTPRGKK